VSHHAKFSSNQAWLSGDFGESMAAGFVLVLTVRMVALLVMSSAESGRSSRRSFLFHSGATSRYLSQSGSGQSFT
jgi:hypothetical protein